MTSNKLDSKIPEGPLSGKWSNHKFKLKLVNPANRRKYHVIIVGSGLAGASAAATLGGLGYRVSCFCFQDSPRRAHSIAAQGGINAAKNYQNDGDSVQRLFYDTIKGGDFRAREGNVHRLAEESVNIIDQCVALGVPFAREYGGLLDNRSFGGAQVSRTFYAKGQTGQQLLIGAYSALNKQIKAGNVKMYSRYEMQDVVLVDGQAKGIICRNLVTGELEKFSGHAVCLATGGYGNIYFLSTNAVGCNATAIWRAHKKGALLANPSFAQIHPTCIPVTGNHQSKLTLMSESLRNDGKVWVPKNSGDTRKPRDIPESERDYFLERKYPSFGNLVPRDVASRNAKQMCDEGKGVGSSGLAVYLDFADSIDRMGEDTIRQKYGNLFDMYHHITDENPYETPMRIYPAVHYTMGGLWVDYNLMTTVPGLFALGEANFSDHGANRLGASALMQGLADGYFVIPYTIADYLSNLEMAPVSSDTPEFSEAEESVSKRLDALLGVKGKTPSAHFHRELGKIVWDECGMSRNADGLKDGLRKISELKERFWNEVRVSGSTKGLNQDIEKTGRVADYFEFAQTMFQDALDRKESCGCHFREEYQTEENEALRNDAEYSYVAAWEYTGKPDQPALHKEKLEFKEVTPSQRSYK